MKLPLSLNLHVNGRLSEADARRQHHSAQTILGRFQRQPGVILGDEVGMGKTFVALAVAAAHVVEQPNRPVVIMVPGSVVRKWERDSNTFRSECLREQRDRARFRVRTAETGIDFLRLLDDPPNEKANIIVLAHGALNRRLADGWTKLAVLQAAIRGRHGVEGLRDRVARWASQILRLGGRVSEDLVLRLLNTAPSVWKHILVKDGLMAVDEDDPVPQLLVDTLRRMRLDEVYRGVVEVIPERRSKSIDDRLRQASEALNHPRDGVLPPIWEEALRSMRLSMPLLVLDEAHRVRNGATQLAQLLKETNEDLATIGGPLAQRFERMLFLTATPFQLGHVELCRVLSRFGSVNWKSRRGPAMQRLDFESEIAELKSRLDAMQVATERLEKSWKRLLPPDLDEGNKSYGERWWQQGTKHDDPECRSIGNERLRAVMLSYAAGHEAIRKAESSLRPWVLRSSRSPLLPPPFERIVRRERLEGASVLKDVGGQFPDGGGGLRVSADNALPFLLSARIGTLDSARHVFGEGLASSYEALLDTGRESDTIAPDDAGLSSAKPAKWHLDRLRESVQAIGAFGRSHHPKVRATIDLAMSLWRRGEKVLIFCHYRHTGRALHRYLSEEMIEATIATAAQKLGCESASVERELQRFIDRLDRDRAGDVISLIDDMLAAHPILLEQTVQQKIHDITLRFLRTPTFLVRFADLSPELRPAEWVRAMFDSQDASGQSLREVMRQFITFLAQRCGEDERNAYLDALSTLQTGSHAGAEVDASFGDDEVQPGERTRLVANVRRVYGDTRDETRDRLMLTFNTPFYPEILIASSVMAEGVDLHLNCRHVIHHDLDWNPSSLEQRTGRVDRLGSKAERAGHSIRVYLPYVEGCQDEKLFRVVMDRERWFGVVMGAEESVQKVLNASAWETERLADQPLVPEALVGTLKLNLDAGAS